MPAFIMISGDSTASHIGSAKVSRLCCTYRMRASRFAPFSEEDGISKQNWPCCVGSVQGGIFALPASSRGATADHGSRLRTFNIQVQRSMSTLLSRKGLL